jgi:hypothetical protein
MWRRYFTVVFAEKGPASTTDLAPVQPYRTAADWDRYIELLAPILSSRRPRMARSRGVIPRFARPGYSWMDRDFQQQELKPLPRGESRAA